MLLKAGILDAPASGSKVGRIESRARPRNGPHRADWGVINNLNRESRKSLPCKDLRHGGPVSGDVSPLIVGTYDFLDIFVGFIYV